MRAKKPKRSMVGDLTKMGMAVVRGKTIQIFLLVPLPLTLKDTVFKVV